jgi:3-carboxy-cis,cis-muconate cycloisomerase
MKPVVHVSDSRLLGHLFSTAAMKAIWSDEATLAGWLKVESTLARVQSELGVVPAAAASAIGAACDASRHDLQSLGDAIEKAAHPLTPVIAAIEQHAGDFAQYVHYGATTQDIMDTGTVLQVRDGLQVLLDSLATLRALCIRSGQALARPANGGAHPRPARGADYTRAQVRLVGAGSRYLDCGTCRHRG